jgi:hypothetical protein
VKLVDNGSDAGLLADEQALLLFETNFAKEARDRQGCGGKPLGCSKKRYIGDCSVD